MGTEWNKLLYLEGDRRMTDIEKYKSIAIKIDSYKNAKPMANEKYMSMGSFVRYLIDKEHEQQLNGKDDDRTKSE